MKLRLLPLLLALLFLATVSAIPAQTPSTPAAVPDDPSPLLGTELASAWSVFGPPASVLPVRGPEAWQDDVVFTYRAGFRTHWYLDRLWRISFSEGYRGSILGMFIGDAIDKAVSLLGQPASHDQTRSLWRLPWRGYPVALAIDIVDGKIGAIAVFRSDL